MKVLEISTGTAAACAGLLLAELGFSVDQIDIGLEYPHIDPDDIKAREVFFNRGKNIIAPGEIELTSYDAVIEDCGGEHLEELGLNYTRMRKMHPDGVLVSLSPFGHSGPYSTWQATDINAQAAGGVVHVSGYRDEAPRKLPDDAAAMIAGVHGATAAVTTVFGIRAGTESGVHIDISAQDTLMQHWTRHISDYAYSGMPLNRQPREPEGIHFRHTARASDGWIFMLALGQPWQDVASFLGLGQYLNAESMQPGAEQPWQAMQDDFTAAVASKGRYQWFTSAADLGWTFAPVEDPWAVASGPQTRARGSMHSVEIDGQTLAVPGLPFRFDE
ncbi:MAG: CoA transferase [Proteobacteria bacterium]|nr:CoA transferase [Pseudomonadota bacterium]